MAELTDVDISLAATRVSPGGWLRGSVVARGRGAVQGLELSVRWLTAGAGSPDERVVHLQALGDEAADGRPVPFEVRLPVTPTSYEGEYLQIRWLVRVRDRSDRVRDAAFEVLPGR